MNAVGIDVSKCKSMVAVVKPFGVVAAEPFEVPHNGQELKEFVEPVKLLPGETKAVMEYTETYYEPIANTLHNAGIFVCVVNPLLIYYYGTNRVRKVKTDKKDTFKIANYGLDKCTQLREYIPPRTPVKHLKFSIGRIFSTTNCSSCKRTV